MTDIIDRIKSLRYVHVPQASQLFEEAIAEIERLREAIRRLADQDATLSVQGVSVTVTMDATLTDKERQAVSRAYDLLCERASQLQASGNIAASSPFVRSAKALQGLWERLGGAT